MKKIDKNNIQIYNILTLLIKNKEKAVNEL